MGIKKYLKESGEAWSKAYKGSKKIIKKKVKGKKLDGKKYITGIGGMRGGLPKGYR